MSKYKLSIIVPVYNVIEYIDKCMCSLLEQSNASYEIILINDGSTDGSELLCNKYAHYDNVKVVHQENKGLAEARNKGLMICQGDYILFVDSDDYITINIIDKLLNYITPTIPDVAFLTAVKLYPDNSFQLLDERMDRNSIVDKPRKEVLSYLATLKKYPGSACTKLVKRSLIVNNHLFFPSGKYSEDLYWTLQVLLHASTFDYFSDIYYYYRQKRAKSITSSITESKFKDSCDLIPYAISLSNNLNNSECKEAIYSFMGYHLGILVYQIGHLPSEVQKKYYKFIRQNMYLLTYRRDFKSLCARVLLHSLGVRITSRIATLYYKIRN